MFKKEERGKKLMGLRMKTPSTACFVGKKGRGGVGQDYYFQHLSFGSL